MPKFGASLSHAVVIIPNINEVTIESTFCLGGRLTNQRSLKCVDYMLTKMLLFTGIALGVLLPLDFPLLCGTNQVLF